MRICFLGTGSGLPSQNLHHSAIYLELQQKKILFDCGEGTSKQFLTNGLPFNDVDYIVISHFHSDHVSGLYQFLQMLYISKRCKPLTVFLPEQVTFFSQTLNLFYLFKEKLSYDICFAGIEELTTTVPEVIAILSDHLNGYAEIVKEGGYPNELRSYSFVITSHDKTVIYSSDISSVDHLLPYTKKADSIILDGSHTDATELNKIIENSNCKIYLTHNPTLRNLSLQNDLPDRIINAEENSWF
ncbi:MAG: MBL fold metallo-hydrolase [Candidatus Cloacimonetes bacterium]|nr:MBL fold metallo-hydrolase [Candidatus Cloacimonadota bacterium]